MSAGRSGACYDDTAPTLHAVCSGTYTRQLPTSSPTSHACGCPCHVAGYRLHVLVAPLRASIAKRRRTRVGAA